MFRALLCSKHVQEYSKCIKIKNLCIKLVNKDYHYIRMHGQQNIKILSNIHKKLQSYRKRLVDYKIN